MFDFSFAKLETLTPTSPTQSGLDSKFVAHDLKVQFGMLNHGRRPTCHRTSRWLQAPLSIWATLKTPKGRHFGGHIRIAIAFTPITRNESRRLRQHRQHRRRL
jgi:hypothetical protein